MSNINIEDRKDELENSYVPIKISKILDEAKELDRVETYVINGVTNEVIKYNPVFDELKINEILKEIQEKIEYIEKNNINFPKDDDEFYKYVCFLMIKKFTHFSSEIADDLETQLAQMNALFRLGYFELIIGEIFNQDEIARVINKVENLLVLADRLESLKLDAQLEAQAVLQKMIGEQNPTKTKPESTNKMKK